MMVVDFIGAYGVGMTNFKHIDKLVKKICNLVLKLTREGDFSEFLGNKLLNKKIFYGAKLTQNRSINTIVKATHMEV
jgi:hypothetical protein